MIRCVVCGRENEAQVAYCPQCGTALGGQPAVMEAQAATMEAKPSVMETPRAGSNPFAEKYLALVILGAMLFITLFMGILSPVFFSLQNIRNIFLQTAVLGILAAGVALVSRAKGPDVSLGALMALGAYVAVSQTSLVTGILTAMLVCALAGAVSGALSVFVGIPSILATLFVGAMIQPMLFIASDGQMILASPQAQVNPAVFTLLWLLALAVCFLLILFTPLGKPMAQRTEKEKKRPLYFASFVIAGAMAGLAGVLMLWRIQTFTPTLGNRYEVLLLIIWAAVNGSSLFDNRFAPALIATAVAWLYQSMSNSMVILNISPYFQVIMQNILLAVMLIPMLLRWKRRRESIWKI